MTRHAFGSSIFFRRDGSPKPGQYGLNFQSDIIARRYALSSQWWPDDATMMADFVNDRYMINGAEVTNSTLLTNCTDLSASGLACTDTTERQFADFSWISAAEGTFVVGGDFATDAGGSRYVLAEASGNRFLWESGNQINATGTGGSVGGTDYDFGTTGAKMACAFDGTGTTIATAADLTTNAGVKMSQPSALYLGIFPGGSGPIGGHIQFVYFLPSRVSEAGLPAVVAA